MSQNIKNNYIKHIDSKLFYKNYFDYMLYNGEIYMAPLLHIQNMLIADFSDLFIDSGVLYSTVVWSGATNGGVNLSDIGLTGVDNGLIRFDRDKITHEEFLKIFLNSVYKIKSGDMRLFLNPVTGNTKMYSYPMMVVENDEGRYLELKGGFYQGFFKLYGFDYQVLPDTFGNDMVFHFDIRPRSDYSIPENSVNNLHPENSGIFFFIGTRAENKFWEYYNSDSAITETMLRPSHGGGKENSGCSMAEASWLQYEDDGYIKNQENENKKKNINNQDNVKPEILSSSDNARGNFLNTYNFHGNGGCDCDDSNENQQPESGLCEGDCDEYFQDDYVSNGENCPFNNGKAIHDEYIMVDTPIDVDTLTDSGGRDLTKRGYYEITESDNKFLMFDRTPYGFTTSNWVEGTKVILTGRTNLSHANYFLLMNRTDTGLTVDTIDEFNEEYGSEFGDVYDIFKDIRNNVFALRVTENGAIGYRYGVLNCDDEFLGHYEVVEEYSKDGIVNINEWNSINVRFVKIPMTNDKCDKRQKKMRILIYVNGFLKLISKQLDSFNFKELNDLAEKQEAVPYSISLGGGSIGLLETILPNYYKINEYILPVEKDFCGTFIGDIKSFQIYNGFVDYYSILKYLSGKFINKLPITQNVTILVQVVSPDGYVVDRNGEIVGFVDTNSDQWVVKVTKSEIFRDTVDIFLNVVTSENEVIKKKISIDGKSNEKYSITNLGIDELTTVNFVGCEFGNGTDEITIKDELANITTNLTIKIPTKQEKMYKIYYCFDIHNKEFTSDNMVELFEYQGVGGIFNVDVKMDSCDVLDDEYYKFDMGLAPYANDDTAQSVMDDFLNDFYSTSAYSLSFFVPKDINVDVAVSDVLQPIEPSQIRNCLIQNVHYVEYEYYKIKNTGDWDEQYRFAQSTDESQNTRQLTFKITNK